MSELLLKFGGILWGIALTTCIVASVYTYRNAPPEKRWMFALPIFALCATLLSVLVSGFLVGSRALSASDSRAVFALFNVGSTVLALYVAIKFNSPTKPKL
jgi:hypothetical protein